MKITNLKISSFILFITITVTLTLSLTMKIEKNSEFKKDIFYPNQIKPDIFEIPTMLSQGVWNSQHSTNSPILRSQPIQNINPNIGMMPNQLHLDPCPCRALNRCQPCGVIPILDMNRNSYMNNCPCAPKLNCPICPPLSLLHLLASKKVYINLNRLNKINI